MKMMIFGEKYLMLMKNHFCHAKDPPESLIFLSISMLCRHGAPINAFSLNFQLFVKFLENAHFCKILHFEAKIAPGPRPLQTRRQNKALLRGPGCYFPAKCNFRENSHPFTKITICMENHVFSAQMHFSVQRMPQNHWCSSAFSRFATTGPRKCIFRLKLHYFSKITWNF